MGRHLACELSEESSQRARRCFEEAIARDPGYALAWAGLAYCHLNAVDLFVTPREAFEGARRAADRALALAPGLAEALICRAGVQLWYDRDRAGTEASCREALEIAPDHVSSQRIFAWYLVLMGRTEEAVERLMAARRPGGPDRPPARRARGARAQRRRPRSRHGK